MATSQKTKVPLMEPGQMKALTAIAVQSVPTKISKKFANKLEQQNYLANKLKSFWEIILMEDNAQKDLFVEEKEEWRKFYQKHFSMELNFAGVIVPEKPTEGIWRLLIIAQGLTMNQVYDCMSKAFKCWRYNDDLDAKVLKNARDAKLSYAIWVRVGAEPDEKYLGKSTNQTDPNMAIGQTLLERMIHEIVFFDETGDHLDIKGITFCTGSRDSDGSVPYMHWSGKDVKVYWFYLYHSRSGYGLREAVSL